MSSEQRVRFEGVSATPQYVTVYFTVGDRMAKRVRAVKVPYADLLDAEVAVGINAEAVRRLRSLWEETAETLPF